MNLSIPKESLPSEKRVAISPDNAASFVKLGYEVRIESGAGELSNFTDSEFEEAEGESSRPRRSYGTKRICWLN